MRSVVSLLPLLLLVALALPLAGCSGETAEAACACDQGKAGEADVWCEKCAVGYVDGQKTGCRSCFDGKTGTAVWCEKCSAGYVDGQKMKCEGCFKSKTGGPPCAHCASHGHEDEGSGEGESGG